MTQLIVRGAQTIDGTTYADGDVFDASSASPADVRQLRREHKLMDVEEYALAVSRAQVLAMGLGSENRMLQAVNNVAQAETHLAAMREQWLALDVNARQMIAKYDALAAPADAAE